MDHNKHFYGFTKSIHHAFLHVVITLLAVGIAFSLPVVADFILFYWWPKVEYNSKLLLFTEISFATALVLLFNISMIAWDGRRSMHMNKIASLIYAREGRGWMSRWKERIIRKKIASVRDVYIMSITGYETFSSDNNDLQKTLDLAYEIRVLLANPYGSGIVNRVQSLEDPNAVLQVYREKTDASIAYLRKLATAGKKVTLKFYEDPPFWKLVVTGDYLWVKYCHHAQDRGFFEPFFKYFLEHWNDRRACIFNFDTNELSYRNEIGNEIRRTAFLQQTRTGTLPDRC
jgi:hypothetical protein